MIFHPEKLCNDIITKMKYSLRFTSFSIFFLLLLVLLISVWFAQYLPLEGFIGYHQNVAGLTSVTVPPYTNTRNITKLYDSLYYDSQTGSVLELFGQGGDTASTDTTGASLTNMVLMPRDTPDVIQYNVVTGHTFSQNVVEPHYIQSPLSSVNLSWIFPSVSSAATLPYNYQVAYFAWKTETVLFIYDILQSKPVGVLPFLLNSSTKLITTGLNFTPAYQTDTDPHNGSYINVMPQYAAHLSQFGAAAAPVTQLYQIAANIWFDTANGVLIVSKPDVSDVVVETGASFTLNKAANTVSTCYFTMDTVGHNVIMMVPMSNKRTMVCVMYQEPQPMGCTQAGNCPHNQAILSIRKVVRFDPALPGGVDGETKQGVTTPSPVAPVTTPGPDTNQYILKTQIVPPVCPACPACHATCPNAQAGAVATPAPAGKNSLSSLIASSYSVGAGGVGGGDASATGPSIVGGIQNVLMGAEGTIGNVVDTAVVGTTLLGLGAIGGVTQLGTEVSEDITHLGTEAGKDVTHIADSIIGGVQSIVNNAMDDLTSGKKCVGEGGDAAAPVAAAEVAEEETEAADKKPRRTRKPRPTHEVKAASGVPGGYVMGTGPGYNTYYGALDGRPSTNFMPVTADFSKFGR
jgi:hypothetical protein